MQDKGIHKGRGTRSNPSGRFESYAAFPFVEDWDPFEEEAYPTLNTQIQLETVRRLINRNNSPDIPFSASLNPYRGCEHGCVYCYARPSHAYMGLSSGLDFESRIFAKKNAAQALTAQLSRPGYLAVEPLVLGSNTDSYQPIERKLEITRQILAVLWKHRHPVQIITKSRLILRDLDLLGPMAAKNLVSVAISLTTLKTELALKMEPRASSPARRLDTIKQLKAAGVPVSVMAAPMILGLNDEELEALLSQAKEAGALNAAYVLLRLPYELKELFCDWLEQYLPQKKKRILKAIRASHGGKLYTAEWGKRFQGQGPQAQLLKQRFHLAVKRLSLNQKKIVLNTKEFLHNPQQKLLPF